MRRSLRAVAVASAAALLTLCGSPSGHAGAKPKKGPKIAWGTYLGGSGNKDSQTTIFDMAVAPSGEVYVVGQTDALDFPVTPGAVQSRRKGESDAYVAKFDKDGRTLLWATYLGGPDNIDIAYGVAVAPDGNVFVTGSAGPGFPIVGGTQAYGGNGDIFLAEMSKAGALIYSTYLGGAASEWGVSLALDPTGDVVVAAVSGGDIPTIPVLRPYAGEGDWYVAKIDSTTHAGVWATFLGSEYTDFPSDVAVDSTGAAVVVGSGGDDPFPHVGPGLGLAYPYGGAIVKFDPTGEVVWSSFLGGEMGADIQSVAIDGADDIYLTGNTYSADFPLVGSPYQIDADVARTADAFATKISKTGDHVVYSIALPGNDYDRGYDVAVTPSGSAAVTVWTGSSDYPLVNAFQRAPAPANTPNDVALTKIAADGTIEYSSFLAGSSSDQPGALAVTPQGIVYVGASTSSTDIGATPGAFQSTLPRTTAGFVAEVTPGGKKHKNP